MTLENSSMCENYHEDDGIYSFNSLIDIQENEGKQLMQAMWLK